MAKKTPDTATEAQVQLRKAISAYVQEARRLKGWSGAELARAANVGQSTISRAIGGKHDTQYPNLFRIEAATGLPIPETLKALAMGSASHGTAPPRNPEVERMIKDVLAKPEDAQRALLDELQRRLRVVR
jgi:transcriptional regulator with XRE-family HTH domain